MCGIAGVVLFDPVQQVDESRLRLMRDTLTHRGPDDAGIHICGPAGLAHRRLSIIDLAGGHQPMGNPCGKTWITYNGEVYNYKDLRQKLQALGHIFISNSDTEVVLRTYEQYGDNCVEHFEGMFAFAIWDNKRQRLFLARDRLGIKPLYFAISETEIAFASEIKAILRYSSRAPVFNRAVLAEYLANRYAAAEDTFFQGISKLLPAHTLSWSKQEGFQQRCYWQPPMTHEDSSLSQDDYTDQVRSALTDAVRSHLVSDVPVGLFLSGGLDSSALAGLMAPMVDGPVHTYSVGFRESEANELGYARTVADSVGARHREILVTQDEFFAALPELIWHEDEPIAFTSSVPLHMLSKLAAEDVKVVLTGEGADELFIGYDYRYRATAFNKRLGEQYQRFCPRQLRKLLRDAIPHMPRAMQRYAERSFLALGTEPRDLFCENFSVFRSVHRQDLLHEKALLDSSDPHSTSLAHFHAAGDDMVQCMSHSDVMTYLVELLMKQDQMSMSASLESRVPFLDHRLVELLMSIPSRFKLHGLRTKVLLRDAVRDIVPPEVLTRGKMGFPVPISSWLRERFQSLVDDFVLGERALARGYFDADALLRMAGEHRLGKSDHGERLWLLINLEMWQRIFIDGEDPALIYPDHRRRTSASIAPHFRPAMATRTIHAHSQSQH